MFKPIIKDYFSHLGPTLSKSFGRYSAAVIEACRFSTYEIARSVSRSTGNTFNTSEKGLNDLLSRDKCQVDD